MKVLVIGATGFLGQALARRLKELDIDVTATGRNLDVGEQLQREGILFIPSDLMDAISIRALCQGKDVVFHCAALAAPWGRYEDFYKANVIGTENVIKGCMAAHSQRLVYVSSPSIYFAFESRLNVAENDPLPARQINAYGKTKLLAEKAIDQAHAEGLPVITIRPRAIFGPGDTTILPRVMQALESGRMRIIGDGENFIDLTYIDNVVDALLLCAQSPTDTLGKKYNITNGEPIHLWSTLEELSHRLGYPAPKGKINTSMALFLANLVELSHWALSINREPLLTRYGVAVLANSTTLNIQAARQELGYKPRISIDEGLDKFVHWWQHLHRPTA